MKSLMKIPNKAIFEFFMSQMPFMTTPSGVRMEVKVFKTRIAVLFPSNRNLLVVLVSPGQLKLGSL